MRLARALLVTLTLGILSAPLIAAAQQVAKAPQIAFLGFPCLRPGWSGPVRYIEGAKEGLSGVGKFPTDEELLAAARTLWT